MMLEQTQSPLFHSFLFGLGWQWQFGCSVKLSPVHIPGISSIFGSLRSGWISRVLLCGYLLLSDEIVRWTAWPPVRRS